MLISFWLCLFVIKLYCRNDIFKHIIKKHGKDIYNMIRSFETLKTKYQKVILDLKFIKTCKKEELIPTFANVRLSLKHGSAKLKKRIIRIIMESEMQVKYQERKKLKQEIKALSTKLTIALPALVYATLLHQINVAVKSRIKSIAKRHEKKLSKFRKHQQKSDTKRRIEVSQNTIHNFSSYTLLDDEIMALNYGLDQHIPYTRNYNSISTEFELFYQNIIRDISNIPEQNLAHVKTKFRQSCEKYCKIKIPFKYKEVIKKLSNKNSIVILKQDKGRGVVIMNRSAYLEKCFTLLNTSRFSKLTKDPTHATERKIQRVVRKMKFRLPSNIYSKIYPTGSAPGKFYGTPKIRKLSPNDTINGLPLRPIVSNIGTATYHLSKYFDKLLPH